MKLGEIGSWVKEHPYGAGAIVFAIGLIILYFYFRKGAAAPAADNGLSSYYAAQATVAASGNQLAEAQIAGNVQTQGYIQAADVAKAQTAGAVSVANTQTAGAVTVATGQQGVDTATVAAAKDVSLAGTAAGLTLGLAANQTNAAAVNGALTLGLAQTNAAQTVALSHDTTAGSIAKMAADTAQYVAYVQALPQNEVSSAAYPASQLAAYAAVPGGLAIGFGGSGSPARTSAVNTSAAAYAGNPYAVVSQQPAAWQDAWNAASKNI